ncbi:MBL fold metallo-hydrolase [Kocuria dechangensis]|uniref:MBL fold metallo-hydrolase n=1 Tax=Kocuria dechangensis TaxID=1176249 RepID=UPI00166B0037|nr:MBL fold metallo-hydrolase [Kocuria dechangensis]
MSRRRALGLASALGLTPLAATACAPASQASSAGGAASATASGVSAASAASGAPGRAVGRAPLTTDAKNRIVLLGTSGGPPWWNDSHREGVSSAVVVGDKYYLVDAGDGVGKQIKKAKLGAWDKDMRGPLDALVAVFLTHLHSDHISDLYNILGTGLQNGVAIPDRVLEIYGPGNRGALPVNYKGAKIPADQVVNPANPTPGTRETIEAMVKTFATDFNDRIIDSGYPPPRDFFTGRDIVLPAELVDDPNGDPHPSMSPVEVFEDDRVKVTATLVQHAPVFPAFAFRFDTDTGSVTFSGDTGPSENLVELAKGSDVLVHEAIAAEWVAQRHPEPRDAAAEAEYQHLIGAHTTIEDVGGIAERAGVKKLVLNHLVPGNWPVEKWEKAGANFSGELVISEDFDAIAIG